MRNDYKCPWCNSYHTWPFILGFSFLMVALCPVSIVIWFCHMADNK